MSCRCKDIRKANQDVNKIEDAIEYVRRAISHFSEVREYHYKMFEKERKAYCLEDSDFSDIENRIHTEDENIQNDLEAYREYLKNQIIKLESAISRMEREDDRYHDDDD